MARERWLAPVAAWPAAGAFLLSLIPRRPDGGTHVPQPATGLPRAGREAVAIPDCYRYGLDTTGAFTSMDVSVIVSLPFFARLLIMSSLVSSVGETPGFHLTMTVRHSGE
jgi:hypothetical protein